MVHIEVVHSDITQMDCDLIILKYANGFHGADMTISRIIDFDGWVDEGNAIFLKGNGLSAKSVLYIGVGELIDFRYEQIRNFGKTALSTAATSKQAVKSIAITAHGPGYGLDEREAFLSLIGGLIDGLKSGTYPINLVSLKIVEINLRRAKRLEEILSEFQMKNADYGHPNSPLIERGSERPDLNAVLSNFGAASEKKPKIFVAMPFADEHSDVWDIAIQEACHNAEIGCERIDEQSFTGDILSEILIRVRECRAVIAVLDGANPNVFLEIGFAWGIGKTTILIARKGTALPFDIRGQKCIIYNSIKDLRDRIQNELIDLRNKKLI